MNTKYAAIVDSFNQASLHAPTKEVIEKYLHIPEINEIDPFGNPMIRPLFSHSSLPNVLDIPIINLEEFNFKNDSIYCTMLHHNAELAVKHLNLIDSKVIDSIRNKKTKLILDNTLEGDTIERLLPTLFSSLDDLQIPYEQVILVTNNLEAKNYYKKWCENNGVFFNNLNKEFESLPFIERLKKEELVHEGINVCPFPWNIYDTERLIRSNNLPEVVNIKEEIEYKEKNLKKIKPFLKVNRTGRPERSLFILYLNKHNLLKHFKISFPRLDHLEDFEQLIRDKFPSEIEQDNINSVLKKVPFDIDKSDQYNHGEPGTGKGKFNADLPFDPIHYKDTFISVVMCAFPHTLNACHLHSSTFNPIYCGHPYIGFGPFNHLSYLKDLGFKTFSKWWDESYDIQPHHVDRLEKVLQLTESLSKYSNSDFLQMYREMAPILQHNSDLIKNFNGKNELTRIIF